MALNVHHRHSTASARVAEQQFDSMARRPYVLMVGMGSAGIAGLQLHRHSLVHQT